MLFNVLRRYGERIGSIYPKVHSHLTDVRLAFPTARREFELNFSVPTRVFRGDRTSPTSRCSRCPCRGPLRFDSLRSPPKGLAQSASALLRLRHRRAVLGRGKGSALLPVCNLHRGACEVQQSTRRRVPSLLERRGILPADAVEAMLQWSHAGGFSVDTSALVQGLDRMRRVSLGAPRALFRGRARNFE